MLLKARIKKKIQAEERILDQSGTFSQCLGGIDFSINTKVLKGVSTSGPLN